MSAEVAHDEERERGGDEDEGERREDDFLRDGAVVLNGVLDTEVVKLDVLIGEKVYTSSEEERSAGSRWRSASDAQLRVGVFGRQPDDGFEAKLLEKGERELRGLA